MRPVIVAGICLSLAMSGCSRPPSEHLAPSNWKGGQYEPRERTLEKAGILVCYVPAGEFVMGEAGDVHEAPVRSVYADAFWIGKTEVTVAQFRSYCEATETEFDWFAREPPWGWFDKDPMVRVTWREARAFCKWVGGDLPTEAQWEKAARGTDGRVFPWGNQWELGNCANGVANAPPMRPWPVGSFPGDLSPYGCLDMAGNVREWCLDRFRPYSSSETRNPTGSPVGGTRVLRSCGWYANTVGGFSCTNRYWGLPEDVVVDRGFRVVTPALR